MSAEVGAGALANGVRAAGAVAVRCPLADGGEGTAAVVQSIRGGELVDITVTGLLGSPVRGSFLLTDGGRTAVVETASASGLRIIPRASGTRRPATSAGTGELLAPPRRPGWSICCPGWAAAPAPTAVPVRWRRSRPPEGCARFGSLCCVTCRRRTSGRRRCSAGRRVLTPAAVVRLTARLEKLVSQLPRDPRGMPRTGAADGLSGALWAVHDAELTLGIDSILGAVGFRNPASRRGGGLHGRRAPRRPDCAGQGRLRRRPVGCGGRRTCLGDRGPDRSRRCRARWYRPVRCGRRRRARGVPGSRPSL